MIPPPAGYHGGGLVAGGDDDIAITLEHRMGCWTQHMRSPALLSTFSGAGGFARVPKSELSDAPIAFLPLSLEIFFDFNVTCGVFMS